jgi:hypothetical protein
MAEYIEREALQREMRAFVAEIVHRGCEEMITGKDSCNPYEWTRGYEAGAQKCYTLMDATPAADVVEVVRCKDCKHHHYICPSGFIARKANDFCSYGERRNNAAD